VVRPTRGWRAILVVAHTNKAMLSDFEFTRYVADLSYLFPLWSERHVLGLRLGGGYVDGPRRGVPFWELEELGGDDTLRGFFPHRFLGTSRVVGTVEYRAQLFAFDFFKLWHVQVDGVAFGEAGRVFIARHVLREDFGLNDTQLARLESALRYSGGGGVRFALSRALIARIDVGLSEEERGLVYLTFGHTF
jgi:outer membrane translocation and assembly module TamA